MPQKQTKLYIYLARRDKKGVEILTVISGSNVPATRVPDIRTLGLPRELEAKITKTVYDERMMWELWVEAAENYQQLQDRLKKRGYTQLPLHPTVRHATDIIETPHAVKTLNVTKHGSNTISQRITQRRTMLR